LHRLVNDPGLQLGGKQLVISVIPTDTEDDAEEIMLESSMAEMASRGASVMDQGAHSLSTMAKFRLAVPDAGLLEPPAKTDFLMKEQVDAIREQIYRSPKWTTNDLNTDPNLPGGWNPCFYKEDQKQKAKSSISNLSVELAVATTTVRLKRVVTNLLVEYKASSAATVPAANDDLGAIPWDSFGVVPGADSTGNDDDRGGDVVEGRIQTLDGTTPGLVPTSTISTTAGGSGQIIITTNTAPKTTRTFSVGFPQDHSATNVPLKAAATRTSTTTTTTTSTDSNRMHFSDEQVVQHSALASFLASDAGGWGVFSAVEPPADKPINKLVRWTLPFFG
jgi:hypothetical protein